MSERTSARLFSGEYDELRAVPVNGFGGRFDECVGECLARVAPRMGTRVSITMDFAVPRFGELADSFSGSCGLEKPFSVEAIDDLWRAPPGEKHRQSNAPSANGA
jgi:hypothetical protein